MAGIPMPKRMMSQFGVVPIITQARKIISCVLIAVLILFFGASQSFAGTGGGEKIKLLFFARKIINPILNKAGLCRLEPYDFSEEMYTPMTDCDKRRHFVGSPNGNGDLYLTVYGITDEKIIREIFLAILNSDLRVVNFTVRRGEENATTGQPILKFTDHTGGK